MKHDAIAIRQAVRALVTERGSIAAAARALGLSRSTIASLCSPADVREGTLLVAAERLAALRGKAA